jgi:hypothetical protein
VAGPIARMPADAGVNRPESRRGTVTAGATSKTVVDDVERQALRADGFDPGDPVAIAAIDLVR